MQIAKPYLDPKLSLSSLAKALHISTNNLSYVINNVFKKSFFDFVNGYRVEAIKQLLQTGAHKEQTLLSLAFDCGFNSKASFNRVFKQVTGHTPTQYMASLEA